MGAASALRATPPLPYGISPPRGEKIGAGGGGYTRRRCAPPPPLPYGISPQGGEKIGRGAFGIFPAKGGEKGRPTGTSPFKEREWEGGSGIDGVEQQEESDGGEQDHERGDDPMAASGGFFVGSVALLGGICAGGGGRFGFDVLGVGR